MSGLTERVAELAERMSSSVGEGWTDPGGTDLARRGLAEEALFLARLVAELLPGEPEALGLLALVLHADARRRARRSDAGAFVPFAEQDPALWDWTMIEEAEALLQRGSAKGAIGLERDPAVRRWLQRQLTRTGR